MGDAEESGHSASEEEESDEEESSSEGEEQERPVKEARKDAVYNTVGLHEKLEEIGWPEDLEWVHSLAITVPDSGTAVDVDDDLSREMAFYTQALEGAKEAYEKFHGLGAAFLRPSDYYAEMVKTDTHMLKIKDSLLHQKTQIEEMDERRKARESKKFSKEVQAEKLKERQKRKKDDIESVKKWRKVRQKSGFTEGGDDSPPIDFDNGNSRGKRFEKFPGRGRESSKSRQFRDSKYGNGGRKSDKRNNAESSADDSKFRASFKGRDRGGSSRGRGRGRGRGGGSAEGSTFGSSFKGQDRDGSSRGRGRGRAGGSFRGRSGSRGRGSSRGRGRS